MPQHKFLIFLCMLYITLMIISGVFVHRVIAFHGIVEPGGIFIFPLTYFLGDVIAEVYGYRIARNVLWSSLIVQFLFALIVFLVLRVHQMPVFQGKIFYQPVFNGLLTYVFWFTLGSILGGMLNIIVITKLRFLLKGKYFWLRSLGATTVGEFIFSIIALTPILMSAFSVKQALMIAVYAYLFKLVYGVFITFPASFIVVLLKTFERPMAPEFVFENPFLKSIEK